MPWSMVGLLAAVGATMYAFVSFAHGYLVWLTLAVAAAATFLAAAATGLTASPAIAPIKKIVGYEDSKGQEDPSDRPASPMMAALVRGLAERMPYG